VKRLISAIGVWIVGSAQARRRTAVMLTFLGVLAIAGCSGEQSTEWTRDRALVQSGRGPVYQYPGLSLLTCGLARLHDAWTSYGRG
jgi:hypothetical protein